MRLHCDIKVLDPLASDNGRVGNGSSVNALVPQTLAGAVSFTAVVAGGYHTCGLANGGTLYCWGDNGLRQLGYREIGCVLAPTPVVGEIVFSSVSARGFHTCGISSDGALYCWGFNRFGQVGVGTTEDADAPQRVLSPVAQLNLMQAATCARLKKSAPSNAQTRSTQSHAMSEPLACSHDE